jgi:hypothetical protein
VPLLRVRASDPSAAADFRQHLARQGFPASMWTSRELAVLFPSRRSMFAPAAELDLWRMNHTAVTVAVLDEVDDC